MSFRNTLSKKFFQVKQTFNFVEETIDVEFENLYKKFKYQEIGLNKLFHHVQNTIEMRNKYQTNNIDLINSLIHITEPVVEMNSIALKWKTLNEIENVSLGKYKQTMQKLVITPLLELKKSYNIIEARHDVLKERHQDCDHLDDQMKSAKGDTTILKQKIERANDLYNYLREELIQDIKKLLSSSMAFYHEIMIGFLGCEIFMEEQTNEMKEQYRNVQLNLEQTELNQIISPITPHDKSCCNEEVVTNLKIEQVKKGRYTSDKYIIRKSVAQSLPPLTDETNCYPTFKSDLPTVKVKDIPKSIFESKITPKKETEQKEKNENDEQLEKQKVQLKKLKQIEKRQTQMILSLNSIPKEENTEEKNQMKQHKMSSRNSKQTTKDSYRKVGIRQKGGIEFDLNEIESNQNDTENNKSVENNDNIDNNDTNQITQTENETIEQTDEKENIPVVQPTNDEDDNKSISLSEDDNSSEDLSQFISPTNEDLDTTIFNSKEYKLYKALYDYDTNEPLELSFRKGDIIKVYETKFDWFEGELNDKRGFVPSNYLTPV